MADIGSAPRGAGNCDVESPPLCAIVHQLRAAGCVFAEDEARLLVSAAPTAADLAALVRRRVQGEPLEVIVGWAEFGGLRILVDAGVFVPRQRTRFLVDCAARLLRPGSVVVDLCCGTGAIAAALSDRVPGIELHAADLDPAAVGCAERNLNGTAQVHQGDLFAALPSGLRGRIDVLVCNAPYVPTDAIELMPPEARVHEPTAALDGGPDGLDVHRRVAAEAPAWLRPGGSVLVEVGSEQTAASRRIFARHGLRAHYARSAVLGASVVMATCPS